MIPKKALEPIPVSLPGMRKACPWTSLRRSVIDKLCRKEKNAGQAPVHSIRTNPPGAKLPRIRIDMRSLLNFLNKHATRPAEFVIENKIPPEEPIWIELPHCKGGRDEITDLTRKNLIDLGTKSDRNPEPIINLCVFKTDELHSRPLYLVEVASLRRHNLEAAA